MNLQYQRAAFRDERRDRDPAPEAAEAARRIGRPLGTPVTATGRHSPDAWGIYEPHTGSIQDIGADRGTMGRPQLRGLLPPDEVLRRGASLDQASTRTIAQTRRTFRRNNFNLSTTVPAGVARGMSGLARWGPIPQLSTDKASPPHRIS
jgi:hypothetical protein